MKRSRAVGVEPSAAGCPEGAKADLYRCFEEQIQKITPVSKKHGISLPFRLVVDFKGIFSQ